MYRAFMGEKHGIARASVESESRSAYTRAMKSSRVLGIMSGTSLDGVDYALCETSNDRLRLRALWSVGFDARFRARLLAAANGSASSWELAQLHHDLGRF